MDIRTLTAAACFTICSAMAGSAATFDYSYTFDNATVVSGSVEGTLQADGNTVSIDSFGSLFVDGFLFFTPLDFSEEITGESANFVLDGVELNLGWASLFDVDAAFFIADVSNETITVGASIDSNTNTFDPNNWIATEQVSAVPLPAGGLLLLSAFGGMAALKRRKKRAAWSFVTSRMLTILPWRSFLSRASARDARGLLNAGAEHAPAATQCKQKCAI